MMTNRVLFIVPALPCNPEDKLYELAAGLKKNKIDCDLYSGLLPETYEISYHYPKSELFSNIYKKIENALLNDNYKSVIFYSLECIPLFSVR